MLSRILTPLAPWIATAAFLTISQPTLAARSAPAKLACIESARGSKPNSLIDSIAEVDVRGSKTGELALARSVEEFLAAASPSYLSKLALALRIPFTEQVNGELRTITKPDAHERERRLLISLMYLSDEEFQRMSPFFLDSQMRRFLIGALMSVQVPKVERPPDYTEDVIKLGVPRLLEVRGSELPSVEQVLSMSIVHRWQFARLGLAGWTQPKIPMWTEQEIRSAARLLRNQNDAYKKRFIADWHAGSVAYYMNETNYLARLREHLEATAERDITEVLRYRQFLFQPDTVHSSGTFWLTTEMLFSPVPLIFRKDDIEQAIRQALTRHPDRVLDSITHPNAPPLPRVALPVSDEVETQAPVPSAPPPFADWRYEPYQRESQPTTTDRSSNSVTERTPAIYLDGQQTIDDLSPGTLYAVVWPETRYLSQQEKRVQFTARALRDLSKLDGRGTVLFPKWLEALRAGPARHYGQKGWKLVGISPIAEFPDVTIEIKLNDTPYRLFGRQSQSGVVEFVAADNEH